MRSVTVVVCIAVAIAAASALSLTAAETAPVKIASAKVTITGTTNVHGYTAATSTVKLTSVKLGAFDGDLFALVQKPALLEAFDVTVPVATLKSGKDGLDKNMYKAMKTDKFAEITFKAKSVAKTATGVRAAGALTIAGVTRDVTLDLTAQRAGSNLSVAGEIPLLMTDYGITPPKAMMGMMKTDPKVVIRIELVLAGAAS